MDTRLEHPVIYEVNAWAWLNGLTRKYGHPVTLSGVPDAEWDAISRFRPDAVWLMGVWERSPAGAAIARQNEALLAEFRRALPDFVQDDIAGSPYCVRRYEVDSALGGRAGLAAARAALNRRGARLILDFVPNHVAPDHPWAMEHQEYFVTGTTDDLRRDPASFQEVRGNIFASGRDPYFPAWPDVLQLNAFHPGLRSAVKGTLSDISEQCDGVRCDMAMLMMNRIFSSTWADRAGQMPQAEYWPEVMGAVRRSHPDFIFMAEAYWDLEWELQQQGFDFCYDKRLYDRLVHDNADSVRLHLLADLSYQKKLVRFIENHDEPRAAATFDPLKHRAAATVVSTLPGALLLHDGQFEGWRVRLPVFLARRPDEKIDEGLRDFYMRLLDSLAESGMRSGDWQLCDRTGWPDNGSFENIVAWSWRKEDRAHLVVVNLSERPAQARVRLPWERLSESSWRLDDILSGAHYFDSGSELESEGLFVDLGPWGVHLFRATPISVSARDVA